MQPRFAFPLLFLAFSCQSEDDATNAEEDCDLLAVAMETAGADATDCGLVALDSDGAAEWACAVAALEAGEAFVIRITQQGIDSNVTAAMLSDGVSVWSMSRDDYGGEAQIFGQDCLDPVVESNGTVDVIGCGSFAPEDTRYQVCGEP